MPTPSILREAWIDRYGFGACGSAEDAAHTRAQTPALLKGLLFAPDGSAMTPTHTRRKGKLYRYYVSTRVLKQSADAACRSLQ
jgi:site-specific DNA recombinase